MHREMMTKIEGRNSNGTKGEISKKRKKKEKDEKKENRECKAEKK
jgi:hypothetical protein